MWIEYVNWICEVGKLNIVSLLRLNKIESNSQLEVALKLY